MAEPVTVHQTEYEAIERAFQAGQRDRDAEIARLRAVLRDIASGSGISEEMARAALDGTDGVPVLMPPPGMGNPAYAAGHRNGMESGQRDRDAAWLRFISDFRMGLNALVRHKDLAESPNQPGRTATLAWLDRNMREFGYTWDGKEWVRRAE